MRNLQLSIALLMLTLVVLVGLGLTQRPADAWEYGVYEVVGTAGSTDKVCGTGVSPVKWTCLNGRDGRSTIAVWSRQIELNQPSLEASATAVTSPSVPSSSLRPVRSKL